MKLIQLPDATIALDVISGAYGNRRACEKAAIQRLMDFAAGTNTEILHRPDGSPYPAPPCHLHISISHSRHIAALLWSESQGYGIDIEEARQEQLSRIAARVMSQDEIESFSDNLLKAWTLKEAAFKAAGLPVADLREFNINEFPYISVRGSKQKCIYSETVELDGFTGWLSIVHSLMP